MEIKRVCVVARVAIGFRTQNKCPQTKVLIIRVDRGIEQYFRVVMLYVNCNHAFK